MEGRLTYVKSAYEYFFGQFGGAGFLAVRYGLRV